MARLLLDHHLSWPRIAEPLRASGHDVRALQQEPAHDGLPDEGVLALATGDARIVLTRNSKDFAPTLARWAQAGRDHGGCILIWSCDHDDYPQIIGGVERVLAEHPDALAWRNLVLAI